MKNKQQCFHPCFSIGIDRHDFGGVHAQSHLGAEVKLCPQKIRHLIMKINFSRPDKKNNAYETINEFGN